LSRSPSAISALAARLDGVQPAPFAQKRDAHHTRRRPHRGGGGLDFDVLRSTMKNDAQATESAVSTLLDGAYRSIFWVDSIDQATRFWKLSSRPNA
jgi:hypothetical protein